MRNYKKLILNYGIITEETGIINKSNLKNRWIIDPIDGTFNFMNGIPQFAISVGYEEEMKLNVVLYLIQL